MKHLFKLGMPSEEGNCVIIGFKAKGLPEITDNAGGIWEHRKRNKKKVVAYCTNCPAGITDIVIDVPGFYRSYGGAEFTNVDSII
jgi:hypothetical protein